MIKWTSSNLRKSSFIKSLETEQKVNPDTRKTLATLIDYKGFIVKIHKALVKSVIMKNRR
jgi:hypothetical protein